MTRNYTALIGKELAEKLRDAGFPQQLPCTLTIPDYAHVFDWLIEKGIYLSLTRFQFGMGYFFLRYGDNMYSKTMNTFQEVATAAIEKALEILEEK